jgi:hypothetical protein
MVSEVTYLPVGGLETLSSTNYFALFTDRDGSIKQLNFYN